MARTVSRTAGGGATVEPSLGGQLVHQPVGQWIAKGHSKFEDVHTGPLERDGKPQRGLKIRIARADVHHQALASTGPERIETFHDAVHEGGHCRAARGDGKFGACRPEATSGLVSSRTGGVMRWCGEEVVG